MSHIQNPSSLPDPEDYELFSNVVLEMAANVVVDTEFSSNLTVDMNQNVTSASDAGLGLNACENVNAQYITTDHDNEAYGGGFVADVTQFTTVDVTQLETDSSDIPFLGSNIEIQQANTDDEMTANNIGDDHTYRTLSIETKHHQGKVDTSFIKNKKKRTISKCKRQPTVYKKAYELSSVTGQSVFVMIQNQDGNRSYYGTGQLKTEFMRDGIKALKTDSEVQISKNSENQLVIQPTPSKPHPNQSYLPANEAQNETPIRPIPRHEELETKTLSPPKDRKRKLFSTEKSDSKSKGRGKECSKSKQETKTKSLKESKSTSKPNQSSKPKHEAATKKQSKSNQDAKGKGKNKEKQSKGKKSKGKN